MVTLNVNLHSKGHTMYPYSPEVTPAVRSHLDAQFAFFGAMSKSLTQSLQNIYQLNVELGRSLLEESNTMREQLLAARTPSEAIALAAARAQPASQKILVYRQRVSELAADAQVELAQVSEQHVHETSRTARALSDEMKRVSAEQTERTMRQQQATSNPGTDPFAFAQGAAGFIHPGTSMQSAPSGSGNESQADSGSADRSSKGNMQGGDAGPVMQSGPDAEVAPRPDRKGGRQTR